MEVTGARGNVVGPANSVSAAIELIEENEVDGAVLDVHLTDGDVAPVAAQPLSCDPLSGYQEETLIVSPLLQARGRSAAPARCKTALLNLFLVAGAFAPIPMTSALRT